MYETKCGDENNDHIKGRVYILHNNFPRARQVTIIKHVSGKQVPKNMMASTPMMFLFREEPPVKDHAPNSFYLRCRARKTLFRIRKWIRSTFRDTFSQIEKVQETLVRSVIKKETKRHL